MRQKAAPYTVIIEDCWKGMLKSNDPRRRYAINALVMRRALGHGRIALTIPGGDVCPGDEIQRILAPQTYGTGALLDVEPLPEILSRLGMEWAGNESVATADPKADVLYFPVCGLSVAPLDAGQISLGNDFYWLGQISSLTSSLRI